MPTENQDDFAPTEGLPTRSGLAGESPEGSLPPGARLGRYRIEALLGRGGMGEVYRAGQLEPVRRTVALKLLHARRVDARHLAYFEIERQLLAQMKHPAIAQVYDAGATPDGYPFFAMEFIEGSPLTTYCEQRALPLRERLELFIRVCEGVQHAHQKGVIHRDLKPGNILVAEVDGRPLPKIIDFGIATAASRSLAAGEHAGELERAGTPDYMSPEQAGLDGVEVDTRSDVYSLGVLLYELLAGRRPGIGAATTGEAHHTASTTVRPPSAQITELAPGNAAARAHQLGLSSPRLRRLLRRELDWVVLKAMRRDRAERYPSAAELAEELRRFLDDRPLQAVPHSRRYVAGKYLRRHRVAVAAASAVALAVLAGLGMSLYGLQQANQQRQIAERRSAELERVAAFQQSMLEGIDIEAMGLRLSTGLREQLQASAPEKLPLLEDLLASASAPDLARSLIDREILHRAEQAIDADFADQPRLAADLRLAVGKVQEALGVSGEAAATYARVAAHHESVGGESAPEALLARQMQAQALINADQLEPARTVNERLLALTEGAPAGDELRLDVESQQATLLFLAGERPKAREMQQSLYDRERARRPADDRRLMALQADLGLAMARMGDIRQARAMYETLHAQASASLPEEDSFRLNVLGRLAVMRAMDGDVENAVELQRQRADISVRKLGAEHPQSLSERGNLANMLLDLRRFDEAEALMRSVLEARERNFGLDSASTLRSRLNLASLLIRRDRDSEEGLALEERVVAGRTRLLGPEHPDTLFIRINHAGSLRRAGHPAQALSEIRAAMPAARKVLGMKHPQAQAGLAIEADSLADLGRSREALPLQQEVLELRRQTFGDEGMETVMAAVALAERHEDVGDAAAARAVRARYVEPLLARPESELDAGERETVRRLREREADGEEGA